MQSHLQCSRVRLWDRTGQRCTSLFLLNTTDDKLIVVYPISDRISDAYIIWDRIYYGQLHILGSHLG